MKICKNLNSITYKDNNEKRLVSTSHDNYNHYRGDGGQMLLVAAIIIAVSVISTSLIAANLANVNLELNIERTTSILPEYRNIRHKFGIVLNHNINEFSDWNQINNSLKEISNVLFSIEFNHGNFFDAVLKDVICDYRDKSTAMVVTLSLSYENAQITEDVEYQVLTEV